MFLSDVRLGPVTIDALELKRDEATCFVGKNGSGKSLLAAIVAGTSEPLAGQVVGRPARCELISSERSQARYEQELAQDDSNFSDQPDYGSTGFELLSESGCSEAQIRHVAQELGLTQLLERGCRQFSSGEWRRVELGRALLAAVDLLVLDDPFESLDTASIEYLLAALLALKERGIMLVICVSRLSSVPVFCERVGILVRGRLVHLGPHKEMMRSAVVAQLFSFDPAKLPSAPLDKGALIAPLIEGRQLCVRYGEVLQFAPFDWTLQPGEHTRLIGENGCGKSTLLGLITGDHPQCYINDLRVVGYKRGRGETIWDVKARIGIVSPALHRDYRAAATALSAVISGYFDSIGLYEQPSRDQVRQAERWLDVFDLSDQANASFRSLSHGRQRLVLVARALIKAPPLLVLDEPTAGLDAANAALVLCYLERLIQLEITTILFVSHRADEHIAGMNHCLEFVPSKLPAVRYEIRASP